METIACSDCDLLQRLPALPSGGNALSAVRQYARDPAGRSAAHSRAIARLSRDIADAVRALDRAGP